MKLLELSCDQSSFHTLKFNPSGLTLIIGDDSKAKSGKGGNSNGAGKTLALGLIHHCLGATANALLKQAVPDWMFRLRFSLNGHEHVLERSGDGKVIYLNSQKLALKHFRTWLDECGAFHDSGQVKNLTFRSLIIRFARLLREDCIAPVKTHKEGGFHASLRSLYLLGIDHLPIAKKQSLKKLLDDIKFSQKSWKEDQVLKDIFRAGTQPKVRLDWLEREIPRLKSNINNFEIAENYYDIEQQANRMTKQLREIEKKIAILDFQIEGIEKSLVQQPDISKQELIDLYSGLQQLFKPEALAHFESVENFHVELATNRITRLGADKKKFIYNKDSLIQDLAELGAQRDSLLRTLDGKKAIDEYKSVLSILTKHEEEHDKLKEFLSITDKLERKAQTVKEQMLDENRDATDFAATEPLSNQDSFFISLTEQLYPHTPSGLLLENNSGENQLRYNLSVAIEGDNSDGISDAKILCFDWTILTSGENHSIGFLWHDNRLFADLSPKPRAAWFEYIIDASLKFDKQYIASINTENFNSMKQYLSPSSMGSLEKSVRLKLTSDAAESKLLGIQIGSI